MVRRRRSPEGPIRYQQFVSELRQYDQRQLLLGLSQASRGWDGSTHDSQGKLRKILPWDALGTAAVAICRGSPGGKNPTADDIAWLCHLFSNVDLPGDRESDTYGLQLVGQLLHSQWPFQRDGIDSWARTIAIYVDTSFKDDFVPKVIADGWDQELFGCSLQEFVTVGFILFAATNNGSYYPFPWESELAELLSDLGGEEKFDQIVGKIFLADIQTIKNQRRAYLDGLSLTDGQKYLREPFSFNPLLSRPLLGGVAPGSYIAPSVPAIQSRCSPEGIIFEGLSMWGNSFTDEAGQLFEQYVGKNFELMEQAHVLPEIAYREDKQSKLSVDWIVIMPNAVFLIECKNSMPTAKIKEGTDAFIEAHARLEHGIKQINKTAALIRESRPEFAHIPTDRRIIGLLTTLGNFETANMPEIRDSLPGAEVPIGIVGPDMVEFIVTVPQPELGELIDRVELSTSDENILVVSHWLEGAEGKENPLLEAAFNSLPFNKYIEDKRVL